MSALLEMALERRGVIAGVKGACPGGELRDPDPMKVVGLRRMSSLN